MQSLLEGMARYHAWASERLAVALAPVPAALLTQPRDLLFGSIDQTLAHLVDVDRLWYGRIARGAGSGGAASGGGETGESTAARATTSARYTELLDQARRWAPLIDSLDPDLFSTEMTITDSDGATHCFPVAAAVLRVFNQATHHRAQLCASLAVAGFEMPELDLERMLAEGGWPAESDRRLETARVVRDACVTAALDAWEDAGMRGLCAEGRWEVAVGAIQSLDPLALSRASSR